MKHGVLWATLSALAFALTAHAITVDGHVFLSGQTDHTGTLIRFRAVSPSARTDSTHSYNTGYFTVSLQPGVYDVEFSNDGYASFTLEDQALLFNTTLETQELMPPLSGNLSGILGPGDFDVVDTIRVDVGDSLRIVAGTRLYFRDGIPLIVEGQVAAQGTEQDSILLSCRESSWSGAVFGGSAAAGQFVYCVVERAAYGYVPGTAGGGAVTTRYGNLVMSHCDVRYNAANYPGAGIYCESGTLMLTESQFFGNTGSYEGYGAAVYGYGPAITITSCTFDSNTSGIYVGGPNAYVARCTFARTRNGYAIYCHSGVYEECLVQEPAGWTAVACSGVAEMRRCTIRGGMACSDSGRVSSSIIAFADDYYRPGVYFYTASGPRVEHCCIYGNAGGNFSGNVPAGMGVVALTNANGDSCDTYYNIFLDPQFADTAEGDYHLTLGSPCIDAGDPGLPYDPDGTAADMGAFYFNQLAVRENGRIAMRPYALAQNYPNPFNAQTRIAFDLARAGEVTLEVFDITGRLVRTLVDRRMAAGAHEVTLDAPGLPSGFYFARMEAPEFVQTRKMVLLK
ncbi:MAG: T9SS type A sorting domain-containing protein [bacterium]|nr:T9SS type A sorting domain-containing protein [bacterium]